MLSLRATAAARLPLALRQAEQGHAVGEKDETGARPAAVVLGEIQDHEAEAGKDEKGRLHGRNHRTKVLRSA